jgi:hypothetical protein
MELNVGGTDRVVRLAVGSALLLLGAGGYLGVVRLAIGPVPQALASIVAILVGFVLFATGVARKCPLNRLLGVNTFRPDRGDQPEPTDRPR